MGTYMSILYMSPYTKECGLMPKTSDAMLKAINKYQTEKVEEFKIRVPKGEKAIIKAHAEKQGKSLNSYVVDLIYNDMAK